MYDINKVNIWKEEPEERPEADFLDMDIAELNLNVRPLNGLRRAGCHTIGEVLHFIETRDGGLRSIRGLGAGSEKEILEKIEEMRGVCAARKETFSSKNTHMGMVRSGSGGASVRILIRPAKKVWDSDIEEFHLSEYALTRLRASHIRKVRDLYANDPKHEPGWYAVRELFAKIPEKKS